jgi:protein-S-isoprenylcysteine O-methyltransferase Ste14
MSENLAAIIWCVGIITWVAIRWPHRRRARRSKTVTHRRSTMEQASLGFSIAGLVVLPVLYLATNLLDFARYTFWQPAGWVGLAAMAGFLILFHLSHKHLARNWSVTLEIRQDHKLVDSGIYKAVRHPMYTSFWLWALAQALLLPNWIAGLSGLASVALLYFSRIGEEEKMMHQQFGAAYQDYCNRTNRLFPKLFPKRGQRII